jgi:plastocyanin
MMRIVPWSVFLAAVLVACGGGGGGSSHVTCAPSGPSLQISAQNTAFDKDCLAAPAGRAFTITFDNKDAGTPHNVNILTSAGTSLFKGAIVTGVTTVTYHVGVLKPGTYVFRCDVHPDSMHGHVHREVTSAR